MISIIQTLLVIFFTSTAYASDADVPFENSEQVARWCENESHFYLSKTGIDAYNWSSKNYVKGNAIFVDGYWREPNGKHVVFCAVTKGAERKFTVLAVDGSRIPVYKKREVKSIVNSGRELDYWCKNESAKYYLEKGITPYNWTSSITTKMNYLFVEGEWGNDSEGVKASCSVQQGGSESDILFEVKL